LRLEIVERQRAEAERERYAEEVRQLQKMEAVGTLASGIAHDFNNLLQAASGYLELMDSELADAGDLRDWHGKITIATKRAAGMVARLLAISRRARTEFKVTNLNAEISQAAENLERTLPREIELVLDLAEDLQDIAGDSSQLGQMVANLATNARDAMPDGGTLTFKTTRTRLDAKFCRTHPGLEPGSYASLRVTDTGSGILPEVAERIYEPFFTTKPQGEGTGLGLAMVFATVEKHRGWIGCDSRPGHGTEFTIYLPTCSEAPSPDDEASGMERIDGRNTGSVLLVDDEQEILKLGSQYLGIHGFSVTVATSGEDALTTIQTRTGAFGIVVLDLSMPGMGGLACLEQVMALDPETRVIVASGHAEQELADEVRAAGARAFLGKPYSLEELLTTIRRVIDG